VAEIFAGFLVNLGKFMEIWARNLMKFEISPAKFGVNLAGGNLI